MAKKKQSKQMREALELAKAQAADEVAEEKLAAAVEAKPAPVEGAQVLASEADLANVTKRAVEVGTRLDGTKSIEEIIRAVLTETIPLTIMAVKKAELEAKNDQNNEDMEKFRLKGQRCSECGQLTLACQEKHVKMVVYPSNGRHAKFFPGCGINGVLYRSNGPGHMITVPALNNLPSEVEKYERNEEEMLQGRTAHHFSGQVGMSHLGGDQPGFRPAQIGWR